MKKADNFNPGKWLVENKITTQSKLNEEKPTDDMVKDYWSIMVENQPEDVIKILVGLTNGDLPFEKFSLDTANDVYDSFKDESYDDEDEELDENQKKYIKIDNSEYYVDENGNVKLSLNFPYEFNRSHKYNTPREEYIDKNNWKEKVNPSYPIMKVINNVPTADYEFIEYPSGDKELLVKTNIEDLKKYADGNYTLK
jgi:hypothetical protein